MNITAKPIDEVEATVVTVEVDLSRLHTITNYAKKIGRDRKTIYNWIDKGKDITVIRIDGVPFIYQ